MTPTHSHIDVELLIEEVRAEAGPQLVSARQQAEQATRDFLDSYAAACLENRRNNSPRC